MSCSEECSCKTIEDKQSKNRYVCFKCEPEEDSNKGKKGDFLVVPFIILVGFALLGLLPNLPNLEIPNLISPRRTTARNSIQLPPQYSFDRRDRVN